MRQVLVLVVMCVLAGCLGPVEAARGDADGAAWGDAAPPAPDSSPRAQDCAADVDCLLLYGVPGDTLEGLCCAGCAPPTALNLVTAADVSVWRRGLDCRKVACPALVCEEPIEHGTAACEAGLCVRRAP